MYEITNSFPKCETYSLTDQIRRSSRSIGANLAEAWRKREYVAHFRSKLSDADAECSETLHWINTASASYYINDKQKNDLVVELSQLGSGRDEGHHAPRSLRK